MNFFKQSEPVKHAKPVAVRLACRDGSFSGQTSGQAPGFAQANLVILPKEYAYDFLLYCTRNPKSCPLLHVLEEGEFAFGTWGKKVDIRTDLPKYRVFRDGVLKHEVNSLNGLSPEILGHSVDTDLDESTPKSDSLWQNDFVTFVIGCSFSFEEALLRNNVPVRHIEQKRNVPMYVTNIATEKSGIFEGPLVVSMRPMSVGDSIKAIEITSKYPKVHGSPIYVGKPEASGILLTTLSMPALGIANINQPDYGDAVDIRENEVCVFWACGVTPQVAITNAKPKVCITHAPGCMLVLDTRNEALSN